MTLASYQCPELYWSLTGSIFVGKDAVEDAAVYNLPLTPRCNLVLQTSPYPS